MRLSAHLSPARHRRPIIWIALAAAVLMILSAASLGAVEPARKSVTAGLLMGMRAVAAQDPDPKTRNPDYLAAKIVNLDIMRERLGWTLDFAPTVKLINQSKIWMFYYLTARTKHFDKVLRKELEAGAKQVVILGAGYDTRGYRFHQDYPKARFFEVDLPAMVADKKMRIGANLTDLPNNVVYAPIDFNTQELGQVLSGVGYKRDLKTVFIWEGVVMYLDASATERTLRFIAENSAPGSMVVFDYLLPSVVDRAYSRDPYASQLADFLSSLGEPLTFGLDPGKSGAFLKKLGLRQVSNVGHAYLVKNYMTSSNGKPLGRMPNFFWIAQAVVPGPGK